MHLSRTHIRFFTVTDDDTNFMLDFKATFFSKFIAPDFLNSSNQERLQICVQRNILLQSLFSAEDTELDLTL
jgi:hypothetical protein